MAHQHHRNPLLIECPPVIGKLATQVAELIVINADEVAGKTRINVRELAT
jgi:hypothetical protein